MKRREEQRQQAGPRSFSEPVLCAGVGAAAREKQRLNPLQAFHRHLGCALCSWPWGCAGESPAPEEQGDWWAYTLANRGGRSSFLGRGQLGTEPPPGPPMFYPLPHCSGEAS